MLSFPQGTEMFQFPWFPPPALCIQTGVTLHDECWVSPFGHLRIEAQSTAPRSFSQSLTSFIGSWRQGIHRWLFVAWKNKDARACSAVLKGHRRRRDHRHPEDGTFTGHAVAAELEGSCRALRADRGPAPSKRKRRQSRPFRIERRTSPTTLDADDRPTSAPTGNWFEPDRTDAGQRLNSSSLERR